ncbi:hypothetical protein [Chondromyces crocatus]
MTGAATAALLVGAALVAALGCGAGWSQPAVTPAARAVEARRA